MNVYHDRNRGIYRDAREITDRAFPDDRGTRGDFDNGCGIDSGSSQQKLVVRCRMRS